jgi:hypothetical protein
MRHAPLALILACTPPVTSDDTSGTSGGQASSTTGPGSPTTSDASSTSASSTSTGTTDEATTEAPMDGLRINHIQAMGTHNSYHVSPGPTVKGLDYTHRPLPEQLDSGARQFELDIHFKQPGEAIDVYHLEQIDMGTTCPTLTDCLQALRGWSDEHPAHHVLYVMIEVKTPYNAILVDDLLTTLEDQILAVWPRERVLAPDDVLHDDGNWRTKYVEAGTAGRVLFPDAFGDLEAPFAAVHTLNDPTGDAAKIAEVIDAGHLVRTRADSDNVEPLAGDTSRGEAAVAGGATFISTDYPPPMGEVDYVFEIPGGAPSRCNPRTAPPDCAAAMIEDL